MPMYTGLAGLFKIVPLGARDLGILFVAGLVFVAAGLAYDFVTRHNLKANAGRSEP